MKTGDFRVQVPAQYMGLALKSAATFFYSFSDVCTTWTTKDWKTVPKRPKMTTSPCSLINKDTWHFPQYLATTIANATVP